MRRRKRKDFLGNSFSLRFGFRLDANVQVPRRFFSGEEHHPRLPMAAGGDRRIS